MAGFFLYRWINRLGELDRRQQQEHLDASMINLERGFSAALREPVWFFRPMQRLQDRPPWDAYAELYAQWKSTARQPQLISTISIAFKAADGSIALRRLQPATGRFQKEEWPSFLEPFRNVLESDATRRGSRSSNLPYGFTDLLMERHPVLALPLLRMAPGRRRLLIAAAESQLPRHPAETNRGKMPEPGDAGKGEPGESLSVRRRAASVGLLINAQLTGLTGWCFLEFNPRFIRTQLLPLLVKQYFGAAGLVKYRVAVVTGNPSRVIYASEPGVTPERLLPFDARIVLFSPSVRLGPFPPSPGGPRPPARPPDGFAIVTRQRWVQPASALLDLRNQRAGGNPGAWELVARDRLGSIAAEIGAIRRRNLAIGFGTLLLLACSIATLVIATHRAHMLAKRQMEFVAGISHELRTPLTVIESAAFNLARGMVEDRGRVRQYGEVIQTEGRRLSDLVGQTLAYAGAQGGRQRYDSKPVHIIDVVDAALSEYDPVFGKEGWRVERRLESNLPLVSADAQILKSVIKNLVGNALNYASEGKWLGVTARKVEGWRGTEVQVSIRDHGAGIDPADLPHIFEPFYRGQKVMASSVPGTGLGLSLVERHMEAQGGRVSLRTFLGTGAEFTLHLPCV